MNGFLKAINQSDINKQLIDIATYNQLNINNAAKESATAKYFLDTLKQLGTCPEFYTLVFSIQDSEIDIPIRQQLGIELQNALYKNKFNNFIDLLDNHIFNAKDDYEISYFLIILEAVKLFTQTQLYRNFSLAKNNLDNDHSPASEQLKTAIISMKKQVNKIIRQVQLSS